MQKVLVTGANGFVGKVLCKEMVVKGWNVCTSVRSLSNDLLPEEVGIIETGSIGPETDWTEALENVEAVVHLAGRVHVVKDLSYDPASGYMNVNAAGTEKLARCAATSGIRLFIFISTVKVNGEGKIAPYTEEDMPELKDPYGLSKWEAEKKLKTIAEETGMNIVIIRAPLIYGPEVKANFFSLLKAVDMGIPFPFAGINNRRSMIYIKNLADLIMHCLAYFKAGFKTYLVSDGKDVSTPDLIRNIAKSLGKPTRLFYLPPFMLKLGGLLVGKSYAVERLVSSLYVDSSKIREELKWKPPFTFEQGIEETAKWYKTFNCGR
ncbi:UDP-glucose 4-epimerase family protein [Desulfobacterium sp. N47]|uniref:UDP-glucose 4-epimerase family protein n=1 Tax=Desulfobacterium sp. N47 TaxID=3115210 RepID=UPI003F49DBED